MRRTSWPALAAAAGLALAGCSGTTDPATEVAEQSAQLNGHGTMDNGPGVVFFQYRRTGASSWNETQRTRLPGGASGAFSAVISGLRPATGHEFRLCGVDDAQTERTLCAQTRTFTTRTPDGDRVDATYFFVRIRATLADVEARSGPAGQNASGRVDLPLNIGGESRFVGFVTCLAVTGNRAAVGAVGDGQEPGRPRYRSALVAIGPPGSDQVGWTLRESAARPSCSDAPPSLERADSSDVYVFDAP